MLKVGLTGNIGTGKSIVAQMFSILNIPVYKADIEAKKFYFNPDIKNKIIDLFGKKSYTAENKLNSLYISEIVFKNKALLEELNNIIHPCVMRDFEEWCRLYTKKPYVLMESAIIFENKLEANFDKIITVSTDETLIIDRVMNRDNVEKENVINRINNQLKQEYKILKSDYVILNNNDKLIIPQIFKIHNLLSYS